MISKPIIKNNFSKCARYYDGYADVQNIAGLRLIDMIRSRDFRRILDIGCGTGNYTRLLKNTFLKAKIKALDVSKEMIRIAKDKFEKGAIEFMTVDAEEVELEERFDLITSNASLQWFEDINKTLFKYKNWLLEDGMILFSTFGPLTFYELNESLRAFNDEHISVSSTEFVSKKSLNEIMKRFFRKVEIHQYMYKERHVSLPALLKKIKYTGTRGNGVVQKGFWTLKAINELERAYRKNFNEIIATYQILFCKGTK